MSSSSAVTSTTPQRRTPILLLKTRSTPADVYEEYFSAFAEATYKPIFVPVLEHRFKQEALNHVRHLLTSRAFLPAPSHDVPRYGGIIFTSQRAVEAFTQVVEAIRKEEIRGGGTEALDELLPASIPFYVVGPATARGLRVLDLRCPIIGEESGNGEALSTFILDHYNSLHPRGSNPPLLFLVGEKRRDIIPKALQSEDLTPEKRSKVEELVIYETGELVSFQANFSSIWQGTALNSVTCQWVVVFSPTGCRAMLESLGLLDPTTGRVKPGPRPSNIKIATIGPTTRDYLIGEFGFCPDVCAERPSPDGIGDAITSFAAPFR